MLMDSMGREHYGPRTYVVAATDAMSGAKALARERTWQKTVRGNGVTEPNSKWKPNARGRGGCQPWCG